MREDSETRTASNCGVTINTPEELENWVPHDPYAPVGLETLEEDIGEVAEDVPIFGAWNTGFTLDCLIRGGLTR